MKNRRITLAAFLLIAVLVMGIGFAALSDNLFISGEATLATTAAQAEFDQDVYFTAAVVHKTTGSNKVEADSSTHDSAAINVDDADKANFNVRTLGKAGEYVTFKFTIKNDSEEFDANISLDTGFPSKSNDDAGIFEITYTVEDGVANEGPITCKAGQTVDVYITVSINASPDQNHTAAFNCNLTATSTDKT